MQKRVAFLVSAAITLALPQFALAHSQSLAPLQDFGGFCPVGKHGQCRTGANSKYRR